MNSKAYFLLLITLFLITSCGNDDGDEPSLIITSESLITDSDGNEYEIGYRQVTSNNQNPIMTKKDDKGDLVWEKEHETSGVDARGILVYLDKEKRLWAVFTIDGGDASSSSIRKYAADSDAFDGVFQNSYGNGGGAKVSVLCEIDPNNGNIKKGTFITARLTSGKTNTLIISSLGENNGRIAIETRSFYWPPNIGKSYSTYEDITDEDRQNGAFPMYYELDKELSEIVVAELQK